MAATDEVMMHALRTVVARENVGSTILALEAGLRCPLRGPSQLDIEAAQLLEHLDSEAGVL